MVTIPIDDFRNLLINIHVIGYSYMGESIVVVFTEKSSGDVIYSIVIDSFCRKNLHMTCKLLHSYNIDKIDLLCWSHPDFDHSLGIDQIISGFCNENTKILIPFGIYDPQFKSIEHSKREHEYITKILMLNIISLKSFNPVSVVTEEHTRIETLKMTAPGEELEIEIDALSPVSSLLGDKVYNGKKIDKNKLSIVLSISLGKNIFLFGSDILNEEITHLCKDKLFKPLFIKIPHHASNTSGNLLDCLSLDKNSSFVCSTTFETHNLPNDKVMNEYSKRCSRVDWTGKGSANKYGIVNYNFDIYDAHQVKVSHDGNASQWSYE